MFQLTAKQSDLNSYLLTVSTTQLLLIMPAAPEIND